ncbi:hypothetical protein NE857_31410 [Nocardiopsis exhalans]|uniref:Uncharacterized protein n=1 Tax=Nocardiopsis exhalans TaxID=163604 RepID=A0ABY5D6Q7_9ACTN|nr:hypothetical protein [Nocardiopsis exhalans]USY19687.1 hypothetical protein NE857_31410 [Nocardiopsis exhalans]
MIDPTNPRFLSQPDPEPLTQLRAATTLVTLIQEDAPAPKWEIADDGRRLDGQLFMHDATDTDRRLDGQLFMHDATDTDRRQALLAWQRVLGAGPVEVRPVGISEHISVSGSYEGVPVRVVTIVDGQCPTCGTNEAHLSGVAA